jgi:hypothetical protein
MDYLCFIRELFTLNMFLNDSHEIEWIHIKIYSSLLYSKSWVLRWPVGPVNPSRGDLSIEVSTVTHMPEGTGQYVVLSVRVYMMEGDREGMMEDEVVLKTFLNLTTSWLSGTHQVPLHLH